MIEDVIVWRTCLGSTKMCLSAKIGGAQVSYAANNYGWCPCVDPNVQDCVCHLQLQLQFRMLIPLLT